jgi:hypothetical protein
MRHDTAGVLLLPVGGGRVVTQELDCTADGLCRIDVKVDAEGELAGKLVECTIADTGSGEPLARATTRVRAPARGRWMSFPFPPIEGSAGRRVVIRITSPDDSRATRVTVHVATRGETMSFEALVRRAR